MIKKQKENIYIPIFNLQDIIEEKVTIITNYRKSREHQQPTKQHSNKNRRELRRRKYINNLLNYINNQGDNYDNQ